MPYFIRNFIGIHIIKFKNYLLDNKSVLIEGDLDLNDLHFHISLSLDMSIVNFLIYMGYWLA
jgi:hypothetical protein